jgi:hypothetical protein
LHLDELEDSGIAGGGRLNLGVGQHPVTEVLDLACVTRSFEQLRDEGRLALQRLPAEGVEGPRRHVADAVDHRMAIAGPRSSAVALLYLCRLQRSVYVVDGDAAVLHVHPRAELGGWSR